MPRRPSSAASLTRRGRGRCAQGRSAPAGGSAGAPLRRTPVWLVVPAFDGSLSHTSQTLIVLFVVLSATGLAGALIAGASTRLAPGLLALAIVPAVGALFVPGLLVIVAALLALQEPQAPGIRQA